ncbi:polysaccharide pyruvyl transferase family protein [Aeromonas veronii]|uniref:polysaccharide pyruvyl transferase family protein n=1 Tax=Aeromonas veronii TaxID=654 RepID=UPI002443F150|nr:polysaccharide pyruvyl transferase family protein [Aeromonas veronii]
MPLFGGGGTCLYSTNNNIKGLFGVLKRVFIAKILGCKFHFLGIGIEPSSNKIADFIYRLILTLSDEIICRDLRSHSILDSYKKNSIVKSDLTYLLEKESRMTSSKSGKRAGDYILFCPAGYKNAYDNLDKLSNLMILLHIRYNKKIVLSSLHDGIDESFINVLYEKLNNKIEIEISYARDINEKISDLSNAYFVIGMRLHSIIIADVFNIPVFGISYQDKVASYLSRFNFLGNPRFFDIFDEYDFELLTSSISEQQESHHVSDFVSSEKNELNKSIIKVLGG